MGIPEVGVRCMKTMQIEYHVDHQTGSHMILRNENPPYRRLAVKF